MAQFVQEDEHAQGDDELKNVEQGGQQGRHNDNHLSAGNPAG